ncbi:MAG: hypothetical protein Q4D55_08025, partial [Eubacteriales bacterium]|nr:hypothetical protein [Eubacteriales bacterium]
MSDISLPHSGHLIIDINIILSLLLDKVYHIYRISYKLLLKLKPNLNLFAAISEGIGLSKGLSSAFSGLSASIGISTTALGGFIAAAAGISAVIAIVDALHESFGEAKKKAEESRDAYKGTKTEIESIDSELKTTAERIDELNSKDGLTVVESAELEKLEAVNQKLLTQKAIKDKIAGIQQAEAAQDAKNLVTKEQTWFVGNSVYESPYGGQEIIPEYKTGDLIDKISDFQARRNQKQKELNDLLEEQSKMEPSFSSGWDKFWNGGTEYEKTEENIAVIKEEIRKLDSEIASGLADIGANLPQMTDDLGNALSGCEDTVERINNLVQDTKDPVQLAQENAEKIDAIINKSDAFKNAKNDLIKMARANKEVGITVDDVKRKYPKLADAIADAGLAVSDFVQDINAGALDTGNTLEVTAASLEDVTKSAQDTVAGIKAVQDVLNGQQTGKSISIDDISSDELKDYRSALEYVNGSMQLNAEKVREIVKAKADEQIAINDSNKALEQTRYLENARQIEILRKSLGNLTGGVSSETEDAINAQIDALLAENSAIAANCEQYNLLSSSIREAAGSYQHWLNAQSASDYGDMANDAVGAIQRIRDTYDQNSDIFGQYGSKKFDAAVDFIIPDTIEDDDLAAIESYMAEFKKYLLFNDDGTVSGLNRHKFLEDAVEKELMSYSEDDGFRVLGGKKMEDFAEGLNMSSGMVQAFFDELGLYGGKFDWSDEAVKTIGDLAIKANEAAESFRNIDGLSDLRLVLDVSDFKDEEKAIDAL